MNADLAQLQPYPFEKLTKLRAGGMPPADKSAINLSIGEPQHPTPDFIIDALTQAAATGLRKYPTTQGAESLRMAIAQWLTRRFQLRSDKIDHTKHILPVNGTREALFAFAQCIIDRRQPTPRVVMPNPFYQIYEGAALLAGAQPCYLNCLEQHDFQPDFAHVPAAIWQDCQLLYLCSPNNPSGTLLDLATLQQLIELADKYDFVIAADECYSELYFDETQPPVGLLQACHQMGREDFKRCVVFHSLSKRSNAPGLRSGFVAGDAEILRQFLLYRTYHGCAMSPAVQAASEVAWQDEAHVQANRLLYREKFAAVLDILSPVLSVSRPPASFYLWAGTPYSDTEFTKQLYLQQNVAVLPGSYLSRVAEGINPGTHRIRIALVATLAECIEAAQRIQILVASTR
jgi:N-succinyldiaminopimelate aminotransferase